MFNKKILLFSSLLICHSAMGNDNVTSVVDSFFNCDNSFFHQLKDNVGEFSPYTDLNIKDDIAYIPVNNPSSTNNYSYTFREPIQYRGLELTGYQNFYINTDSSGKYYYWGFMVNNSMSEIQNILPQLSWQIFNETTVVANPKLYEFGKKNRGWQNNPYVFDGVIPRANTVEKSVYLEKINDNQTLLLCTLQGDINKDLLYSIHPDMKYIEQEYTETQEENIQDLIETNNKQNISPTVEEHNDALNVN